MTFMRIDIFASSDVGLKREHNEDSYLVLEKEGIIVVCDGMGDNGAGEIASQLAVDTIKDYFQKVKLGDVSYGDLPTELPYLSKDLIVAIRLANRRTFQDAESNPSRSGMGTTVAAIVISGNIACIAHVGDSRVYRIRNTELQQLTADHTPILKFSQERGFTMDEALEMNSSNIVSRALGVRPTTAVDVRLEEIKRGDTFLVCSDGLSGMVSDQVINDIMLHTEPIDTIARQLIEAANMAGGKDNVTVAIARIIELDDLSITLQNPQVVVTIPEEKTRVLEKEDKLIATLFSETASAGERQKGWIKYVFICSIVAILIVLYLLLTGKIAGLSGQRTETQKKPSSIIQHEDSTVSSESTIHIPADSGDVRISEITGHIFLEVFPYSDSIANAYELAVDGEIFASFAELRQSGLILTAGEHILDVCNNGIVIYSKRVNVTRDGQELEPLSLDSIIQRVLSDTLISKM
jgi:serine/threonine protein phosphatase PrpC